MIKIFNYSLNYTFRKKSTWIFLSFISLIIFAITYLMSSNAYGLSSDVPKLSIAFTGMLAGTTMMFYSMLTMSYIAIKSANIFKDGENDGSTLLLASKQFTRTDIIVGRFMALLVHILLVSTFAALGVFISDSMLPGESGFTYVASIFLGSIIVCSIFSSITLLIALVWGKVGTLFVSMLIGAVLPILSLILTSIGNTSQMSQENYSGLYRTASSTTSHVDVDSDGQPTFKYTTGIDGAYNDDNDPSLKANWELLTVSSYNTYKWFDFWYQISSPLTMFAKEKEQLLTIDVVQRSESDIEKIMSDNSFYVGPSEFNEVGEQYLSFSFLDDYTLDEWSSATPVTRKELVDGYAKEDFDVQSVATTVSNIYNNIDHSFIDDFSNDDFDRFNRMFYAVIEIVYNYEKNGESSIKSSMFDQFTSGTKMELDKFIELLSNGGANLGIKVSQDVNSRPITVMFNTLTDTEITINDNHSFETENYRDSLHNYNDKLNPDQMINNGKYAYAAYETMREIFDGANASNGLNSTQEIIRELLLSSKYSNSYFTSTSDQNDSFGPNGHISTMTDTSMEYSYTIKPYLSSSGRITFWLFVGTLLFGLSFFIYYRRDFK